MMSSSSSSASSLSPIVNMYHQENVESQYSNDRLASLIEAVRFSEMEKAHLRLMQDANDREIAVMKETHADEKSKLHKRLAELSFENEALVMDFQRKSNESSEFQRKLQTKCEEAEEANRLFEVKLNEVTNRYDSTVAERKKLIAKVKSLKHDVNKQRRQSEEYRSKWVVATNARLHLENVERDLRQDLLIKNQVQSESLLDESTFAEKYQIKFTETLMDQRKRNDERIRSYKNDIESLVEAKTQSEVKIVKSENDTLKNSLSCALTRVNELDQINSSLNVSIGKIRSILDAQVALNTEIQTENCQLRDKIETHLESHKELDDLNVSNSWERATWDELLCGGEEILKIKPPAKRRRVECANNESGSVDDTSLDSHRSSCANDEMQITMLNGDVEASVQQIVTQRFSRYGQIRQQVIDAVDKCILM